MSISVGGCETKIFWTCTLTVLRLFSHSPPVKTFFFRQHTLPEEQHSRSHTKTRWNGAVWLCVCVCARGLTVSLYFLQMAQALNSSTGNSLVLIDEFGKGTNTVRKTDSSALWLETVCLWETRTRCVIDMNCLKRFIISLTELRLCLTRAAH